MAVPVLKLVAIAGTAFATAYGLWEAYGKTDDDKKDGEGEAAPENTPLQPDTFHDINADQSVMRDPHTEIDDKSDKA